MYVATREGFERLGIVQHNGLILMFELLQKFNGAWQTPHRQVEGSPMLFVQLLLRNGHYIMTMQLT